MAERCLTNEEDNLSSLVLVHRINMSQIARQFAPHFRNFVRVPAVQAIAANAPQIASFEDEYLAPDDGDGVVGRIARVRLRVVLVVMGSVMPGRWLRCCRCCRRGCCHRRVIARLVGISRWIICVETVSPAVRIVDAHVWIISTRVVASRCGGGGSRGRRLAGVMMPSGVGSPLPGSVPGTVD